jgi:hypothetical protein
VGQELGHVCHKQYSSKILLKKFTKKVRMV